MFILKQLFGSFICSVLEEQVIDGSGFAWVNIADESDVDVAFSLLLHYYSLSNLKRI